MSTANEALMEQAAVQSERALVDQWLVKFDTALQSGNHPLLASLFIGDSHWRDLFAFTWTITPSQGADTIAALLLTQQAATQARHFAIAQDRTAPRRVTRTGLDLIEAFFQYETAIGRGYGVVRLSAQAPTQAFQLMTHLHELKGHEEKVGRRRRTGEAYSRNFGGTNWKEQRAASQTYSDRAPTVLVVGGGQAGLSLAARLVHLGVDTLVIDRLPRVGDCWRTRYHSLALHNPTDYNHLPYMPFPPNWPVYLSKDMVADWFEAYAWAQEINFWTSTELASGSYDQASGRWSAVVRNTASGAEHTLHPKHLVFANGLVGFPHIPELPGLDEFRDFKGEVMHTTAFTHGAQWRGKKALVLGTGTSAHDVAQELHSYGAGTTLIQRGSTMVLSIDPSAKLSYGLYQDVPLEDGDMLVMSNTLPVLKRNLRMITARMVEFDRKMIDGLIARGFKWHDGDDHAGHNMMIRRRYGGYYLDAGCADLIINGNIGLLQHEQIERFAKGGALLKDGTLKPADLIVLATGYVTQEVLVGKLLGADIAKKIGPVWGIAEDGEMRNMWKRTAQEGLWFVGGSFANCRIFSRYVALQIKAIEEGLLAKQAV